MKPASVYVHFPYCLAKCPYCDFTSFKAARNEIDHEGYADAVIAELSHRAPSMSGREVETIFFGGGTPSLWDHRSLGRVLAAIEKTLHVSSNAEVTVECNPTSLDHEKANALADVGVNRLSIGTQSLDANELQFLGRLHDAPMAIEAIRGAVRSRIARVSADLIFGLPSQPRQNALSHAQALIDEGLTHVSCYQLTIEPGTRFGELAKANRLPKIEDQGVAEAFLALDDLFSRRGYLHYEISNYAMKGAEARHNLGYWRGLEYLGLGCGAFGFLRTGKSGERYRNQVDPLRYVAAQQDQARTDATVAIEALSPETLLRERIMLGLRTSEGIDLGAAGLDLELDPWTDERSRTVDRLVAKGRLARTGQVLTIPSQAWLFTDDTAARLF